MNTAPHRSRAHPETRTTWPGWGAVRLITLPGCVSGFVTRSHDARRLSGKSMRPLPDPLQPEDALEITSSPSTPHPTSA
jgi:hypothetical protein